ncbi:MAG: hypothetical protein ACU0CA_06035 [Paracoccaceae bacterium]
MQFIDQAAAYTRKSISLEQALSSGRAKLTADPDWEKLAVCFRPELELANAFDRDIDARLSFKDLSTPAKLDLLIDELLPEFFHADLLALSGRDNWIVRFVVDGGIVRTLKIDSEGVHPVDGQDWIATFELETDIMTLFAILRSVIADFHLNMPPETDGVLELSADQAAAIYGGMPVPDPKENSNEGDEGNEGNEDDINNTGDEKDEDNEDDENDENDEGNEGNEGDEGFADADDSSCAGYVCGADGGEKCMALMMPVALMPAR